MESKNNCKNKVMNHFSSQVNLSANAFMLIKGNFGGFFEWKNVYLHDVYFCICAKWDPNLDLINDLYYVLVTSSPITTHVSCHKSLLFGKGGVLRKDKTDTTDICLTQCRARTKHILKCLSLNVVLLCYAVLRPISQT